MLGPDDFTRRIREAVRRHSPNTLDEAPGSRAAVAVVVAGAADPAVLLIRREERHGDPWSGQMAFPGGYAAPGDSDLAQTAMRETLEETGLDLTDHGELVGALDDLSPRSRLLPSIVVRPFVFLTAQAEPFPAGPEVAEVLWLRVVDLFDAANRKPFPVELPIGRKVFDSIQVGSCTIWGLTERVLDQLRRLTVI